MGRHGNDAWTVFVTERNRFSCFAGNITNCWTPGYSDSSKCQPLLPGRRDALEPNRLANPGDAGAKGLGKRVVLL
jgi:hypothetical protein